MGLESLPLLASIWSAILTVAKILWDTIKSSAQRAAFYFATVVPMIVRWFVKRRVFFLGLLVLIFGVVRTFLRAVSSFLSAGLSAAPALDILRSQFKWMYYLIVHGPLALDTMYAHLLDDIIPLWVSLVVLKWLGAELALASWIYNKGFQK